MTEAQRIMADGYLDHIGAHGSYPCLISYEGKEAIKAYRQQFERMRQFIRNLADESRVYLESEE